MTLGWFESYHTHAIFIPKPSRTSFIDMNEFRSHRAGMIGCAIGSAVIELTARGLPITKGNILYELERIAAASSDLQVKAFALDAAKLLRAGTDEINA